MIVGQETDGTVTLADLGLDWAIGKAKKDFVGKRSLTCPDIMAENRKQLVGLLTDDPNVVLEEGAQVTGSAPPPRGRAGAAGARRRHRHRRLPAGAGARDADPSYPTVTIYNHLDVQPADPAEWKTPPFTFTRQGERYMARGATDDKGPALTALYGARLALETGARVNIQFLWELEEEIGSPHFARGLAAAIAGAGGVPKLATESVVVSDTIWTAAGKPSIPYGLRGLMGFTVSLQTGAKDVHSGTTGGAARNPVAELAALVAACVDARTGRVKIPGFYDDVRS